ncbi:MAG TPA: NAD-dependent epimerase/dehydratase family protein, partial [Thermoanaerobacterales bacterium]|nr:NAD-dependent epimerase/dehydratase family protein [Thermoanaerobacterales bacterium]
MILVTGSTGHIGNVLIRKLVSKGKQVRAMVLPGETYHSLEGLDIEIIEGNVLDITSLERAFKDINVLYHLAGIISIIPDDEEKMWKVNVEGTRNVSEVAHKVGVNRMVHVSSIHAFERQPHGIIVDENTPLISPDSKTWGYDKTKAEGTHEVLKVVKKGLNAVIVCPTGIIGPYDFFSSETGQLIRSFTNKKIHPLIHGSYDFVDVRDVVNGLLLAEEKGRTGEIYILSGTNISLVKIKELVQEIIGIRTPHVIFPFRLAL